MANEHLTVTIEANGSLTIIDRRTGKCYTRLLTFEDCADIGDGWNYGVAQNDQIFTTTAARASVALIHNGPQLATLRVRTVFDLPEEFEFRTMARSERSAPMLIDSLITLHAGAEHVEVETTVNNVVRDHRLRVMFPTGIQAHTYWADSPFDVIERPIALRQNNHLYRELEVETEAATDLDRGLRR